MNEFEQAEERRKRQREEIKQKRIRQLRRRMTISGCILLCIIIALAAFAVNVAKKKKLAAEQKKQLEQEIAQMNESLNDCYNTFLTDNGVSAEKSDVTAFTKWLEKNYSEEIASKIDNTAKKFMDQCYEQTKAILLEHRDKLTIVAEKLMEQEVLSGEEFEALMDTKYVLEKE